MSVFFGQYSIGLIRDKVYMCEIAQFKRRVFTPVDIFVGKTRFAGQLINKSSMRN